MVRTLVVSLCGMLLLAAPATSQTFFSDSTSSLSFSPSPEGPGIAGCAPKSFQCDFQLNGAVTLEVEGQIATIDVTSLELIGNDGVTVGDGSTLAESIRTSILVPFSKLPFEQVASNTWQYAEFPEELSTITANIQGNRLQLIGGIDETWIDGEAYRFDLTGLVVPEPTSSMLVVCFACCILQHIRNFRSEYA